MKMLITDTTLSSVTNNSPSVFTSEQWDKEREEIFNFKFN